MASHAGNDPFHAEAPVPSVSSGFSLLTTDMQESSIARMNTNRDGTQNDTYHNLLENMDLEKPSPVPEKASHSIGCGDDDT
jgi:hypothetical protein